MKVNDNYCMCEDLPYEHGEMCGGVAHTSKRYNDHFYLEENYGTWKLCFSKEGKIFDTVYNSMDIFYCPFCGRKLNHWDWAEKRRRENFEEYLEAGKKRIKLWIAKPNHAVVFGRYIEVEDTCTAEELDSIAESLVWEEYECGWEEISAENKRKINLYINTNDHKRLYEKIIEVDFDYTNEELDEDAKYFMWENYEYGWGEA